MGTRSQTAPSFDPVAEILAPSSCPAGVSPQDDLYAFLIGSWELDVVSYPDDGDTAKSIGEAHAAWVLGGRAIQDVFINPRRSDRTRNSPKFGNWYGTTFRYFDPAARIWRAFWFNPEDGVRAELVARRHGSDVVQEGCFPDGALIRWTYSEITPESCRWHAERLAADGSKWRLQVEFRARRVLPPRG